MGLIKNMPQALQGVDLSFAKVSQMPAQAYREFIWDLFLRILRETPQFSGKGVANWNLSIGAPNFGFDPTLGDEIGAPSFGSKFAATHERGDEKWMRVARNRARPIMKLIRARDKVFISNGTTGDGDEVGAERYIEALQNQSYWVYKLREVNKPYEVAEESLVTVAMKFGRRGFFAPKIGGASWETA